MKSKNKLLIKNNINRDKIRYLSLIILMLFSLLMLASCDFQDMPEEEITEQEKGDMKIFITIPEELQAQNADIKSILSEINLDKLKLTIARGEIEYTETAEISGEELEAEFVFQDLVEGAWELSASAIDDEGIDVAFGSEVAAVEAGETKEQSIELDILPGDLNLAINAPDNDQIKSGRVVLDGVVEEIEDIKKDFDISAGEHEEVLIDELLARIWPAEFILYDDQQKEIISVEDSIVVKPGRQTKANIDFDKGSLQITVDWELPPSNPQQVIADYNNGHVNLSWQEVEEADGYLVFRSQEEDDPGLKISDNMVTDTDYRDEFSFSKDQTYWYRVVAYKNNGLSSDFSESATVTPEAETELQGNILYEHNFPFALVDEFTALDESAVNLIDSGSTLNHKKVNAAYTETSSEKIVGYNSSLDRNQAVEYLQQEGYVVVDILPNINAALVESKEGKEISTADTINILQSLSQVRYAEVNQKVKAMATKTPDDELYGYQWHYPQIRLPQAWRVTTGSSNVNVAVLDTGINVGHEDLGNNIDEDSGYNFVDDDDDFIDHNGHGTHVAGTIAANSNNNQGVAGTMWESNIIPVKVMDDDGTGDIWDIAQGILYASGLLSDNMPEQKADIINLSLGSPASSDSLEEAVSEAAEEGVIMAASAGNAGEEELMYPAAYEEVISVGAVDFNYPHEPELAWYSNYSDNLDVLAPGGDLEVNSNQGDHIDGVVSPALDEEGEFVYRLKQGTSMAAPHVSGILGLMLANGVSVSEVREMLKDTAMDLDNVEYGSGLVNAYWAVSEVSEVKVEVGKESEDKFEVVAQKQVSLNQDSFLIEDIPAGEYKIKALVDVEDTNSLDPVDYYFEKDEIKIEGEIFEIDLILEEVVE